MRITRSCAFGGYNYCTGDFYLVQAMLCYDIMEMSHWDIKRSVEVRTRFHLSTAPVQLPRQQRRLRRQPSGFLL